jgi:class 3 adenylate cyclase
VAAEAPRARRKLAAILMADVAGFSRLMARDEEGTTREIQAFHARVRERVAEHEGRIVDTAGDSVFGEFDSVVLATRCAQAIQADQALRNASTPRDQRIETRIGVHVGDVIVEEYKIYGDGVNIAARLEALAEPGEILVSEAVYQQVRNKVDAEFSDAGVRALKNIDHPVRVYRLIPSALVPVQRAVEAPAQVAGPRGARLPRDARSLADVVLQPNIALPLVVGLAMLVSPILLFPTAGLLPAGGSVLTGLTLGRVADRRRGRRGGLLVGLGLGLAACALLTRWGPIMAFLFVLSGVIVGVQGLALAWRSSRDDAF